MDAQANIFTKIENSAQTIQQIVLLPQLNATAKETSIKFGNPN